MQGRAGALLCNLSTLPALLTSPMFHAGIAPLESVLDQVTTGLLRPHYVMTATLHSKNTDSPPDWLTWRGDSASILGHEHA